MSDDSLAPLLLVLLVLVLAVVLGLFLGTAVRQQREAKEWELFSAEHCRISGSYDRESKRASNVQAEYELKIYHCDDGSIHVR